MDSVRTARILVVEDDLLVRNLLMALLTREGYEVQAAPNVQAALAILEGMTPDLLITEIELRGASGLELIGETRRQGLSLPALVVSSLPEEHVTTREDLGRVEYIPKPFGVDAIRAAVERLLTPQNPHHPPAPEPGEHRSPRG